MRILSQFFEQRLRDSGYTPQSDEDPSYPFTLDQILEDLAVEEESENSSLESMVIEVGRIAVLSSHGYDVTGNAEPWEPPREGCG